MRKLILIIILLFPLFSNAECTNKEKVNLNKMASFVDYSTEYDEKKHEFKIIINNVNPKLEIRSNLKQVRKNNENIVIENLIEGEEVIINIYSSNESTCVNEFLRTKKITIPYVNKYYKDPLCKGHEKLPICKSKFINFLIDDSRFFEIIRADEIRIEREKKIIKEKPTKVDKIINTIKEIIIKLGLTTLGGIASYSIFKSIYDKIFHNI